MADKKPLKFWEDTTGSPWVLYFSWNNEENMPSFRMVSNTPPVGSSEGEEDFTYAIRVSENTKNQIDKFDIAFDEDIRPYIYLIEGETYEYASEMDRQIAEMKQRLKELESEKLERDGTLTSSVIPQALDPEVTEEVNKPYIEGNNEE